MSLFGSLFGGSKALSEEKQRELASSLLQEAESLARGNPKKAIGLLARKGKPVYELWRLGGELHGEFRALVEKTWTREGHGELIDSAAVLVIPGENDTYPTVGELVEKAAASEAEVVYLPPPLKRSPRNAVAELEALRYLVDPEVGMVIVGEEGMFFRGTFVLAAGKKVDPNSEEVGQDLMDEAQARGLKVAMVVA